MKLRNKIAFTNTLITLVILLISSVVIVKAVDNFNLYTVYQSLLGQSDFSQQYLAEYLKLRDDPAGVLADERKIIEEKLENQADCTVEVTSIYSDNPEPLHEKALEGYRAYLIAAEGSNRQFYMASPVLYGTQVVGSIIYRYSLYNVDSMRRSMEFMLLALFAVAIAVSLILNYFLSFRVIKPLEKLTEATKEFSRGNFKEGVRIRTGDEIERLALSFNDMGANIMEMLDKLKKEHAKQKKFLDDVTHEIRTPLTNILGYTDLSNRVAEEEQKKKYNSYIISEGNRLLAMVNNLLELSQLNRYELSLEKEETDLAELIEQISMLMADRAKKFGFNIVNDVEHVKVSIDREKIKQVIINLIDNAIKYSEGSTIELKLKKEKMIHIQVIDNGIGIPEEDINSVTQPFYRVDKSRSRKLGGNGLGLSICKEIIAAHGGTMAIESGQNPGTIVTISLQP